MFHTLHNIQVYLLFIYYRINEEKGYTNTHGSAQIVFIQERWLLIALVNNVSSFFFPTQQK